MEAGRNCYLFAAGTGGWVFGFVVVLSCRWHRFIFLLKRLAIYSAEAYEQAVAVLYDSIRYRCETSVVLAIQQYM